MKKKFNKELGIGISVICAIAILIVGIEYLKGINMFSPANFYYAYFDNVDGLEVSSPVSIDGFKVGQVRDIKFDYDHPGKIKVLLAVNKQLKVPEDSRAILGSTLMGSGFINIKMGKSPKMLAIGSDIQPETRLGLMDAVSKQVMPAIGDILPKVDSLVYNLNLLVTDPSIKLALNRFDGITGNVLAATQGLNRTMNSDIPAVMGNARRITVKIDSISNNLVMLSNELNKLPLAQTMDNVHDITANLSAFSTRLNDDKSTLGLLTKDPELYNRINRVAADVDSLILDIKKNPKRYISIKLL
ncbi:MAG: MlaD family protein [Muribaculaceae bacterium]|nr:MlaD family protein [Muribaculaceae bacterium]